MSGSYASLYYHLVFSTQERRRLLTPEIAPRIHDYLGGIIRGKKGIPLLIGGQPDHVHILTALDKCQSVADVLRDIKSNSTSWIHRTLHDSYHFAWQEGYGAFTVSPDECAQVKAYIANQEAHHRHVTFQEELLDFLHRYHISYDARYIWR